MPATASTIASEWPSEKNKPTENRPLAVLHQLADHIVDRRDMVGVDRVPQSKHIGEECGAQQRRPPAKASTAQVHTSALATKARHRSPQSWCDDRSTRRRPPPSNNEHEKSSPDLPSARARTKRTPQTACAFRIIHGYTPTHVCRVDPCDGRSPGSRIVASFCLPGVLLGSSGVTGRDYPLTVAGAAADLADRLRPGRTAFPFRPHVRDRRWASDRFRRAGLSIWLRFAAACRAKWHRIRQN